ncbi:MAG TPA: UBP-type zinc finger domain-containing protein [Pyrinomonadaceae bacterium]
MYLRLCESCGHVGCCDNSSGRHVAQHSRLTGHPVIKSFEPGEEWGWCYVDEVFFESLQAAGAGGAQRRSAESPARPGRHGP